MRLVVSRAALSDLQRLRAYLDARDAAAAADAARILVASLDGLLSFPQRGRPAGSLREIVVPFGRSAYVVRYAITQDEIIVVRIWHGREARP